MVGRDAGRHFNRGPHRFDHRPMQAQHIDREERDLGRLIVQDECFGIKGIMHAGRLAGAGNVTG